MNLNRTRILISWAALPGVAATLHRVIGRPAPASQAEDASLEPAPAVAGPRQTSNSVILSTDCGRFHEGYVPAKGVGETRRVYLDVGGHA